MTSAKPMEFVFVVPREELFVDCTPHGLQLFDSDGLVNAEEQFLLVVERSGFFVERAYAERTPALKQVIPYTLVVRRGSPDSPDSPEGQPEIFRLTRTKAGGEARLHNKLSIGVGGHIEPVDLPAPISSPRIEEAPQTAREGNSPRNPIPGATRREVLEEELEVTGPWSLRPLGLINDDTNPVGAVHVGLVQVLEVSGPVRVRETEQLIGHFVPLPELLEELAAGANYESWSSLILPNLGRVLAAPDSPSLASSTAAL